MKTKDTPLVSIITVCLNSEKTIQRTIESALGQTYKNIEYIIVDGQSMDGTLDIIKKYKGISLISEPDDGIYDAMNKGIQCASGEIIGILNSDDWYEADAVERIVTAFRRTDADVVYGKVKMIYPDQTHYFTGEVSLERLWYDVTIMHPTVFVKRDTYFRDGLFDLTYEIAADYELFLRLYINKVTFAYEDSHIANFVLGGKSSIDFSKGVKEVKSISLRYADKYEGKENIYELIETRYKNSLLGMALRASAHVIKEYFEEKYRTCKEGIFIWGAGYWGMAFRRVLNSFAIPVVGFIDNKYIEGQSYMSLPIYAPSMLKEGQYNIFVAVDKYCVEIVEQVKNYHNNRVIISTMKELKEAIYEIYG